MLAGGRAGAEEIRTSELNVFAWAWAVAEREGLVIHLFINSRIHHYSFIHPTFAEH